jgi:hypothetical protein
MRFRGELIPGRHEPMIIKPVFDYAQQILAGRAQPRVRRRRFLYRGVLRCGGCGSILTAEDHTKHYPKTGRKVCYVYYRCTRAKNPHCREGYIREESLEAQFAEQLGALQPDEDALEGLRQALHELHGKEQEYRRANLAALRTRYDGVQKKRDILMDRYLEGVILAEDYQRKTAALRE